MVAQAQAMALLPKHLLLLLVPQPRLTHPTLLPTLTPLLQLLQLILLPLFHQTRPMAAQAAQDPLQALTADPAVPAPLLTEVAQVPAHQAQALRLRHTVALEAQALAPAHLVESLEALAPGHTAENQVRLHRVPHQAAHTDPVPRAPHLALALKAHHLAPLLTLQPAALLVLLVLSQAHHTVAPLVAPLVALHTEAQALTEAPL